MAVQKTKTSKSRTKTRHSTWVALNRARLVRQTNVIPCPKCAEPKLAHTICPACNEYGSVKLKEVVNPEETPA